MLLHDDRALCKFLILEGAQAGLSCTTIFGKRLIYRSAFDQFDTERVACCDAHNIESLLRGAGIVHNRLKIQATVTNAQEFFAAQNEFGSFDVFNMELRGRWLQAESLAQFQV